MATHFFRDQATLVMQECTQHQIFVKSSSYCDISIKISNVRNRCKPIIQKTSTKCRPNIKTPPPKNYNQTKHRLPIRRPRCFHLISQKNAFKPIPNHPCHKRKRGSSSLHSSKSFITPPSIPPPIRRVWRILMLDLVIASHHTSITRRSAVTSSRARAGRTLLLLLLLGASVSCIPTRLSPIVPRSWNRVNCSIVLLRTARAVGAG